MERWPNFFIVGAPKTGTTSLYWYLSEVPGIYMPPIKEPNYFSVSLDIRFRATKPIRDKNKYLSLFKKVKDEKIIGDASPQYLFDPQAPKLIHQVAPDARILISLRDPIDRLYSRYLGGRNRGIFKLLFHEEFQRALNHRIDDGERYLRIEWSLYSENVKRYLDIFGPEQMKVIIFEEWTQNVKGTIEEIVKFLGLNSTITNFGSKAHNTYAVPRGRVARYLLTSKTAVRIAKSVLSAKTLSFVKDDLIHKKQPKPKMKQEDRDLMLKFYRDDVKKLQSILGRKLPWPNFDN